MKKKYKIRYTWHSGECFGATMQHEVIYELEEEEIPEWKKSFQDDDIDGSYRSIDSMTEVEE